MSEVPQPSETPVALESPKPRFSVGALVRLLANPARAAEELSHGLVESIIVLVPAVVLFAFCFQFMLPRLKDEIPVLGTLREGVALVGFGHDVMEWDLFWPELLAAMICVAVWYALHLGAGFLARQRGQRCALGALGVTAAAAVPVLLTSVLALVLYHVREVTGALFFLGFLFGAFVCYHALVTRYTIPRWLAIYIAPLVFLVQMYVVYALMP